MPKDLNSVQSGMLNSTQTNDPSIRVIKGKNLFPQSFQHPSTCSYGVVDPVAVAKCERGDVYPYKFVTDLNTFTLSSPMKSKVNMYTAAFKVPMQAIYPRNWDIMFPIPNKGDDVPESTRSILYVKNLVNNLLTCHKTSYDSSFLDCFVRTVFILESIFSDGGIFAKMNLHLNSFDVYINGPGKSVCFDDYFDLYFVPSLKSYFSNLPSTGPDSAHINHLYNDSSVDYPKYCVTEDTSLYGRKSYVDTYYISFERAIELLRSGEYYIIPRSVDVPSRFEYITISNSAELPERLNIESIVSYQLACSHFINNPKIDFVYTAQLYRDNMESIQNILGVGSSPSFIFPWNGIRKLYDVFSAARLSWLISGLPNYIYESPTNQYYLAFVFFQNLFNYQKSLRYGDYFTGAHPEPIAPGDINAPVIDGSVNALDMTRKIQMARLLNKVNISGPRISDYLRTLWGGSLPEAPKDSPIRLSKEVFSVGGFEVNNTGSAQLDDQSPNITTTNLRLDDSKYLFEVSIDEPCWIVVVQYFDAHRIYSKTIDRFAFHFDRFDDFLPDLQFDGDQDIKSKELDATSSLSIPFAYNLRYMEYKQRYSYASGGFIRRLKSWALITDNKDGNPMTNNITPEYIRSSPSEFDRFYKSLNGYSLGTRFHFITFNTNVAAPYRQMVYAPEILS